MILYKIVVSLVHYIIHSTYLYYIMYDNYKKYYIAHILFCNCLSNNIYVHDMILRTLFGF